MPTSLRWGRCAGGLSSSSEGLSFGDLWGHLKFPRAGGLGQALVVAFVLVGAGRRKLAECLVESGAAPAFVPGPIVRAGAAGRHDRAATARRRATRAGMSHRDFDRSRRTRPGDGAAAIVEQSPALAAGQQNSGAGVPSGLSRAEFRVSLLKTQFASQSGVRPPPGPLARRRPQVPERPGPGKCSRHRRSVLPGKLPSETARREA